jgi:hypothetical protein
MLSERTLNDPAVYMRLPARLPITSAGRSLPLKHRPPRPARASSISLSGNAPHPATEPPRFCAPIGTQLLGVIPMDGKSEPERLKVPTWPGSIIRMPRHEYMRRRWELDRNYSVAEWGGQHVVLRLDFPGEGLADASELLQSMHFESLMRYGSHLVLYP